MGSTFFHCRLAGETLAADGVSRLNKEKVRKGIRSVKIADESYRSKESGPVQVAGVSLHTGG